MKKVELLIAEVTNWAHQNLEPLQAARGNFLINEGQIEHHIYLILDGAVCVNYQSLGEEFAIRFGYNNDLITSIHSFFSGAPSQYSILALRKTQYYAIPKSNFLHFVHQSPQYLLAYTELLQGLVIQQMEREIDLLTVSPSERVDRVLKRSPKLFQEIPLKYIASYLRMSPETLSRIRKS